MLYVIDPSNDAVITVGCITNFSGLDTSIGQLETTCLGDTARTYVAGLSTPGAASFSINTDPADSSHIRLHALKVAGTSLRWAIGWSDGTAPPTFFTNGDFSLPTTRSWLEFDGFMNSFSFTFALDSVVTSEIGLQVSGEPVWTKKV